MSAGNSAYSPLPQSNSDSECSSEEELHVSQGNRIVNRATKGQNSKGEKTNNDKKNNVSYNILDNDGDVGIALNKFQSGHDEVSIVKPDGGLEIFSTSRKICFVFSLLLCVFTTVAFIWILPCNVEPCPNAPDLRNYNFSWEENLPNLEIYGPISLASDGQRNSNLLFLTRSLLASDRIFFNNTLKCLKAKDGSPNWNFHLDEEPTDVDCQLIDLNADGVNDCLIYGTNLLKAINPISGSELWDIEKSNGNKNKLYLRDFPLVVADVDGDKTKDFLLTCSFGTGSTDDHLGGDFQNYLVVISGKTGTIISKPLQIKPCSSIIKLTFENSTVLSYTCFSSSGKEFSQRISLVKILRSLKIPPKENVKKFNTLKQHLRDSNTLHMSGFRLILENHGDCPEDCDVLVDIRDEHDSSKNKSVFFLSKKSTFGMVPVMFKTKRESGFIIKFWKWISKTANSGSLKNLETDAKQKIPSMLKRSKETHHLLNNSTILDKEMVSESEWESQRKKRTACKLHRRRFDRSALKSSTFNMHWISENIIKININQSQIAVRNLTNYEITQMCNKPKVCLPDASGQMHSVLVTSLGDTEDKVLVTYTSTYKVEPRELQSRIRILNI